MKTSRERILKRLRKKTDYSQEALKNVQNRLDNAFLPYIKIPTMDQTDEHNYTQFVNKTLLHKAEYDFCETQDDIPPLILQFLKRYNLPHSLKIAPHVKLEFLLTCQDFPNVKIKSGFAIDTDSTSLSLAYGAIAENGSVMIASSNENPASLNFLPENHIIILEKERIFTHYEAIIEHYYKNNNKNILPRFINFIAGPSRSADIEQTLLLGAHGPQRVYIICCNKILSRN